MCFKSRVYRNPNQEGDGGRNPQQGVLRFYTDEAPGFQMFVNPNIYIYG